MQVGASALIARATIVPGIIRLIRLRHAIPGAVPLLLLPYFILERIII